MNDLQDYRIGIVGAGSWGTALANMLAEKGYSVTLWVYEQELFEFVSQKYATLIGDIEEKKALDDALEADMKKALDAFKQVFKA